ncbi:glycosyltransferase [Pedobacter paludis]|uniref:Glycosyl transferase n=1 Tax=Pedobacter paludis TaxID=2203212 RepID=A0A317EWB9_9SPHI|nr:glycosyltransferase [Pedobacter paludis]PWS31094.1 glycosyl transferase [Pedobacter paludis]
MKIYNWIDKYNQKVTFKILRKYNFGIAMGKSSLYYLNPKFYPKYLLRLLLVFFSTLFIKKSAYTAFNKLFSNKNSAFYSANKNSVFLNKIKDTIATLFGYRYFVDQTLHPLLSDTQILKNQIQIITFDKPLVSIIIPVFNHLDFTYNCIKSLQHNISSLYSYEIIVIDDCSTDATQIFFDTNTTGVRYFRNAENLGFIRSCNLGVEQSKGELVCFLNNDIQVCENWLESLVNTMNDDKVGCVGSKLVYPNGLLQEAGAIVYKDASAANYGRYNNPDHPEYNYLREVDYCSGASLIFRKKEFIELGYFDKNFIPAYYEDTDMCFSIRHTLKKKVVYQPLSMVIHFEGISSGLDIDLDPVKKYQKINKAKFQEKWKNELREYQNSGDETNALGKYLGKKTVLFIDDVIPAPDKDSGSNRLFQIIKLVKSLGYHIIFVPNDGIKRKRYFEHLVQEGVEVIYRFPNRKGMLNILQKKLPKIDFVWLCKLHNNYPFEYLFEQNPHLIKIYDTIDLHFLRMKREADLVDDLTLLDEANKIEKEELGFAKKSKITIAITNDEQKILEDAGVQNTFVIPNIHNPEFSDETFLPFEKRTGLVFIGGYAHKPNIDSAKWLINEIMPKVWKVEPDIKITLLGSNPNEEVLSLKSERVIIPGYIEDVSSFFNKNRIFVAPLRYGAGMKGKIGQSLSYGLPIVTSTIGAEGIGLTDGENYLLANTDEEFAKEILRLYNDEKLWNEISNSSKQLIQKYKPENTKKVIEAFLPRLSD